MKMCLTKSVIVNGSILFLIFLQTYVVVCQTSNTNSSSIASKSDNNKIENKNNGMNNNTPSGLTSNVSDDDLEKLLEDKRYLMRQIKCALGEGVCDPVGRRLKSLAPLVLRGACPKCSPTDKRQIQKTLSYVQRNYPKDWSRLMATYAG